MCRVLHLMVVVVLLTACAHDPSILPRNDSTTITVYLSGGVNNHGKHTLAPPFTVEHAIQQAGGLEFYEQDLNRMVFVKRKDSREIQVKRKDYASYILADGDSVIVPRH